MQVEQGESEVRAAEYPLKPTVPGVRRPESGTRRPGRKNASQIAHVGINRKEPNDGSGFERNIKTLAACNKQEKELNAKLAKEIEKLNEDISKLQEALQTAEPAPKEQTEKIETQPKVENKKKEVYLPQIPSALIQQQTQLEISYQRKILEVENRNKDLSTSNKRLIQQIQSLENSQEELQKTKIQLRDEKQRINDELTSSRHTLETQSSIILSLKAAVQELKKRDEEVRAERREIHKVETDLRTLQSREMLLVAQIKKLEEELHFERESVQAKVAELQKFQHREDEENGAQVAMQRANRALEKRLTKLMEELQAAKETCTKLNARIENSERVASDRLAITEALESERNSFIEELETLKDRLHRQEETEASKTMESDLQLGRLMQTNVDLTTQLTSSREKITKLESEIDKIKLLSQDETVRALQLGRQKDVNHEAITILTQERDDVEAKLREALDNVKHLESEISNNESTIEEKKIVIATLEKQLNKMQDSTTSTNAAADIALNIRLAELQTEYDCLMASYTEMDEEYQKLLSRKYKTEAFQSQTRMLRNENKELSAQVDKLYTEIQSTQGELKKCRENIKSMEAQQIDPNTVDLLKQAQSSLQKTVEELEAAETASESSFTCLQCMKLYEEPITLVPCGHTYCSHCLSTLGNVKDPSTLTCKNCVSITVETTFPNHALADLTARFVFRRQSLSSLTSVSDALKQSVGA